jgi:hypothetical protein
MKFLSIEELGVLKAVVNRTWQEIGSDLLEIIGSNPSRDSVFEVCTDRLNDFADSPEEKKIVGKFLSFSWNKMQSLKKELLPFAHYE